jgi:transcriptional regulator with XRE-family HTH domain
MSRKNVQMPPSAVDPRFGAAIRRLRQERGLSQERFAGKAGITISTINATERSRTNPTWTTVVTLAEGLDMSVAQLAEAVEAEAS